MSNSPIFTITVNDSGIPEADFDLEQLSEFLRTQGPAGKLFTLSALADITTTIVTVYDELEDILDQSADTDIKDDEEGDYT